MPLKSAAPVDVYVGKRIRLRRRTSGMSQGALAHAIGVTFQQVQKYENGSNRVSASRLQQIADILEVPAAFFFDGVGKMKKGVQTDPIQELLLSHDNLVLLKTFSRIADRKLRARIIALIDTIAEQET